MRTLKTFSILCPPACHLIYDNSHRNCIMSVAHPSPDFFIGSLIQTLQFTMMDDLNSRIPPDLLLKARSILLTWDKVVRIKYKKKINPEPSNETELAILRFRKKLFLYFLCIEQCTSELWLKQVPYHQQDKTANDQPNCQHLFTFPDLPIFHSLSLSDFFLWSFWSWPHISLPFHTTFLSLFQQNYCTIQ